MSDLLLAVDNKLFTTNSAFWFSSLFLVFNWLCSMLLAPLLILAFSSIFLRFYIFQFCLPRGIFARGRKPLPLLNRGAYSTGELLAYNDPVPFCYTHRSMLALL